MTYDDWIPYFDRIGWPSGSQKNLGLETLRTLHNCHQQTFPFENLSVFLTHSIGLTFPSLWEKMVQQRRGGWCFETNGLLSGALEILGFPVRTLMARNLMAPGKPRSHMILLVNCEGVPYVVDAGFGGVCPRRPHPLHALEPLDHQGLSFRLIRQKGLRWSELDAEPDRWILQNYRGLEWVDIYGFSTEAFTPADYLVGNHFHSTSPQSPFTQNPIVVGFHPSHRWSLSGRRVKEFHIQDGCEVLSEQYELTSPEEIQKALLEKARLELSLEAVKKVFQMEGV